MGFHLGDEPVDPRYARFRDGWDQHIIGKVQYIGLRWSPWEKNGEWIEYKPALVDYLDFGQSGPASPLEAKFDFNTNPAQYRYEWKSFGDDRPKLWSAIEAIFTQVKASHATAVWNPYDGSWREIRWKGGTGGGGKPGGDPPINPELQRRLDELHALWVAKKITDEIYKQRVLELLREYG